MVGGLHRGLQLTEIISDVQRYLSRNREAPEAGEVRLAISSLEDARRLALASQSTEEDKP